MMGFTTPNLPAVEPDAFLELLLERIKIMTLKWGPERAGAEA